MIISIDSDEEINKGPIVISDSSDDDKDMDDPVLATYTAAANKRKASEIVAVDESDEDKQQPEKSEQPEKPEQQKELQQPQDSETRPNEQLTKQQSALKNTDTVDSLTPPPPTPPTRIKKAAPRAADKADRQDNSKILAQLLKDKKKNDTLRAGAVGQEDAYKRFLERERQKNEGIDNLGTEPQNEDAAEASSSDDDEFITVDQDADMDMNIDAGNHAESSNENVENGTTDKNTELDNVLSADKENMRKEKAEKQYKPNYNFFDISRYQDVDAEKFLQTSLDTIIADAGIPQLQRDCLSEYSRLRSQNDVEKQRVYLSIAVPVIALRSELSFNIMQFLFHLMILHKHIPTKDTVLRVLLDILPRYSRETVPFGLMDLIAPLTVLGVSATTENLLHGNNEKMVSRPLSKKDKKEWIAQTATRVIIMSRLIALLQAMCEHSLFDVGDTSGLFTMMILLSMDRSVSSLYRQIVVCANVALNSVAELVESKEKAAAAAADNDNKADKEVSTSNETPTNTLPHDHIVDAINMADLNLLMHVCNAAFCESSAYQLAMLHAFPAGTLRAMRMRRWLAWAILLEGKDEKIDSNKYMKSPNILPLVNQLQDVNGRRDSKFGIHEDTNYDHVTNCVEILSIVLTDVETYLNEERELIRSDDSDDEEEGKLRKDSIFIFIQLLRNLSGMIVDTRKADLDKSRCKDVIQRLEMRLHWQRSTFLQNMQTESRT